MAAPHAEKLEGGVPAPPPPPGPPHPAGSAATGGPGRKQGKAGLQMKSPEKKRRKSNTQGPAYSHLSEFAPPPTPMVDHLVASNPFEDDFGSPKVGAAAAPAPFLGSPGPFGGFRLQGGMSPQVPPGYGGGPQPLRRQPPPFGPAQMGPAFGMPPQGPGYAQPAAMGFPAQPFAQPLGQNFSPPAGQLLQGPVGGFGPMISPSMGQPPRADVGPGPALNPPGAPAVAQRFAQPGNLFGQSPLQRAGQSVPPLPPTASPFPGADPAFPPGGEEGAKSLNPPPSTFAPEQHSGSPAAAVNGAPPAFTPGTAARGTGTPETNSLPPPPPGKAAGASGHQPPPGLVYPCGACRNEVNDDQDAILCEASCQKWFHRECTGMTENAYGLLTTEASAVWACDFCLKTKEIQSVYIREGMGQLVAANDG
ncbi:pygopus homolog 2 isoform 2-T2 [Pterocles gutturalis]